LITWNICSATTVNINAFNFAGNLLAPLSDVIVGNAQVREPALWPFSSSRTARRPHHPSSSKQQIVGNVVARSFTGTGGGEVHLPVF
jgi:hypothetical protein